MTFADLTPPYSTIVADPPWPYARPDMNPPAPRFTDGNGALRSSGVHADSRPLPYSSMTLDAIKALPVGELGDDCRCFLWTTNRFLPHSWDVLEAWGFDAKWSRVLVWCKAPRGTAKITTEFVLIGKRGNPPPLPWHNTTWFQWPLQPRHSQKPDAFLDLVESWCPGPYVELFARAPRLGWDHWGHGHEETPPLRLRH